MGRSKKLNARSFVSVTIFLSFLVMLVTSVLMFSRQHDTSTALVHTIIGFVLLFIAFWHLKNNFKPLKQHLRLKIEQDIRAFNLALPVALLVSVTLVVLSAFHFSPFLAIYQWGNSLRAGASQETTKTITYQMIDKIQTGSQGVKFSIDLRKGPYFAWPQYAIWVESMDGQLIQPLFVTSAIAKNNFTNKVTQKDNSVVFDSHILFSGKFNPSEIFEFGEDPASKDERMRPESLPVFLHKLGKKTESGILVPAGDEPLSDAYTGATMTDNFLLKSQLENESSGKLRVRFEINHSFDFNDYYSSDRFPDDPVYSGNGYSAQPSVIYEAIIDPATEQKYYPMKLIGRGHHSGRDGEIYTDLANLTTALELVDRVIVEFEDGVVGQSMAK